MTPDQILRERARIVMEEARRQGDVSLAGMEKRAESLFQGHVPHIEQQEIIQLAAQMHETEPGEVTRPTEPTRLNHVQTRELAVEFFRNHPEGTSAECYDWVAKSEEPSCSRKSFLSSTAVAARKQLGITASKGPGKRAPKKQSARKAVTPKVPESVPDPVQATPSGPAASEAIERERIEIRTPGGTLVAEEQGSGWWFVEFKGPVESALLRKLVADIVKPLTERAA